MQKLHTNNKNLTSRRAVAPVIATLLLVAIAVVGGSIIFVFSQGFFSTAQVSGAPQIESIEIVGYDASDIIVLQLHDGILSNGNATSVPLFWDGFALGGTPDGEGVIEGERVAVYLQNQSAQRVTLEEIRLAGNVYEYVPGPGLILEAIGTTDFDAGQYVIVQKGNDGTPGTGGDLLQGDVPIMEAGEEVTILLELSATMSSGRDAQFKIETANGAVFVGTIIAGQQSG